MFAAKSSFFSQMFSIFLSLKSLSSHANSGKIMLWAIEWNFACLCLQSKQQLFSEPERGACQRSVSVAGTP